MRHTRLLEILYIQPIQWRLWNSWSVSTFVCHMHQTFSQRSVGMMSEAETTLSLSRSRLEAWNVLSFYRAVLHGHAWKSLILCSTEESRLYEFGTTRGSENEQFFLFDWRVPLNMHDIGVTWWLWVVVFNKNPGKLSEIKRKKNYKHVHICPWMPSSVHSHVHAQIKETVSSHKWDFPRPDLNDPSLSVEHEDSRGRQRWNTEQSGGTGLSKGYKPELCGACGYSNTESQWGEKQTKWKKKAI